MTLTRRLLGLAVAGPAAFSLTLLTPSASGQDVPEPPWDPPVAAISPDGNHVATLSESGRVRIWAAGGEKPIREFDGPDDTRSLTFVSKGTKLVVEERGSFDKDGDIRLHDLATGKQDWKQSFRWPSDHHGGHMSRPAIVVTCFSFRSILRSR